jgi:hypothetical protein
MTGSFWRIKGEKLFLLTFLISGGCLDSVSLSSHYFSLLLQSSHLLMTDFPAFSSLLYHRDSCDYIGSSQTMQDNFPNSKSLIYWDLQKSVLPCKVQYSRIGDAAFFEAGVLLFSLSYSLKSWTYWKNWSSLWRGKRLDPWLN